LVWLGYVGVGLVDWVGVRLAIFAKTGVGLPRFRLVCGGAGWFVGVQWMVSRFG
jgi:hypothetical protein